MSETNEALKERTVQTSVLTVPGCINRAVYESLKQYLVPPVYKLVALVLTVGYVVAMLYQTITTRTWANLLLMVLLCAFIVWMHFHNQKSTIDRIVKKHRELQQDGYDVMLQFGQKTIKLLNRTTGAERNIAYADLKSMVETEQCIACFTKKNNYLMIPKNRMTEDQHQAVVAQLRAKCPNMKKRW